MTTIPAPQIPSKRSAGIECIAFRRVAKGTLLGFAALKLPSGMILVDCAMHSKNNSRWVSTPSRPWVDANGARKYAAVVDFIDRETRDRFSRGALEAIDRFLAT